MAMASGKMMDNKGMACSGGMCMACGAITSVVILLAGLVFFLAGYGVGNPTMDWEIGGILLLLYGLVKLVHSLNLCPMCKK